MGRRVLVAICGLSTTCAGIDGGLLDGLVYLSREVTDIAIVLVGGEAACDVDSVEQPLAGSYLRKCGRRRVSVRVDPEGGAVVQEEMIEHERLQNRDATVALHAEQGDAVFERGK
jgi:hypothetical protein